MNKSVSQIYRALFSNFCTLFCVPGAIFLLVGMLHSNKPIIDLAFLNPWEESLIFLISGIACTVFGLLFLWLHSRETRKRFELD